MSDETQNFQSPELVHFGDVQTHRDLYAEKFSTEPSAPSPQPTSGEEFIVVNGEKSPYNLLEEAAAKVQEVMKNDKIVAEADSSSSTVQQRKSTPAVPEPVASQTKLDSKTSKKEQDSANCSICPYYMLSCDYISKIQIPPYLRDLLLWKDPKFTGAVFGTELVLLISLASFSFLTVIGSLMLLALTAVGSYRFYLAFMFRIKGIPDETFDKLSNFDLSLPKEKVKQITVLLEQDINKLLNKIKSIILWDNIYASSISLAAFYFVYCVGSVFNTLTLVTLCLVTAFTLPKAYDVYKVQIDALLEKATATVHMGVKQAMKKVPFLNQAAKKVQ